MQSGVREERKAHLAQHVGWNESMVSDLSCVVVVVHTESC